MLYFRHLGITVLSSALLVAVVFGVVKLTGADTDEKHCVWAVELERSDVTSVSLTEDGRILLAGRGGELVVLDTETGEVLDHVLVEGDWQTAAVAGGKAVFLAADDYVNGYSMVWEQDRQRELTLNQFDCTLLSKGHTTSLSANGEWLAVAHLDPYFARTQGGGCVFYRETHVKAWRLGDPSPRPLVESVLDGKPCIALSADGQLLAVGSSEGEIGFFQVEASDQRLVSIDLEGTRAVAFAPDGHAFASSGPGNAVQLCDLVSREVHLKLRHRKPVGQLAFSSDGRHLVTSTDEGRVVLWNIESMARNDRDAANNASAVASSLREDQPDD